MDVIKVYKTEVSEITKEMTEQDKTNFVKDIINLMRNYPNYTDLGHEVDKYIKKTLNK